MKKVVILSILFLILSTFPPRIFSQDETSEGTTVEITTEKSTESPSDETATSGTETSVQDDNGGGSSTMEPLEKPTNGPVEQDSQPVTESPTESKTEPQPQPEPEPETTELTTIMTTTTTTEPAPTTPPWMNKPKPKVCRGISHSVNFYWTCCDGKVMRNGLDIDKSWSDCYKAPENPEESISETMRRFYDCFLDITIQEHSLKRTDLPQIMTKYFLDDYQKKIVDQIKIKMELAREVDEVKLKAVYHNTEKNVCEGKSDSLTLSDCSTGTGIYQQNVHFGGDCCNGEPIPIPLEFLRREPSEELKTCTLNIINKWTGVYGGFRELDFYDSGSRQICFTACVLSHLGYISEESLAPEPEMPHWVMSSWMDDVRTPVFEYTPILDKLTVLFSPNVVNLTKEAFDMEYGQPENFTAAIIEDDLFYNQTYLAYETEFYNMSWRSMKPMFVKCEAYNIVVRDIERVLMDQCYNDPKGNTEVPPPS